MLHHKVAFFLLAVAVAMLAAPAAMAQDPQNFPPDNRDVKLSATNLPIVLIDTDGQTILRDNRVTAHMTIIDNGKGNLNYADTAAYPNQHIGYDGWIGIRYRGNSSYGNADKKPYSFKTLEQPLEEGGKKEKVALLGMGKDNDWCLLSAYADLSLMRDLLAFDLARPYLPFTPQGRYCELLLDGIYYGVYILCERNSHGKHRLNIGDPDENYPKTLPGGFYVEVDRRWEPGFFSSYRPRQNNGETINKGIYFQYKYPEKEDLTEKQQQYVQYKRIRAMEAALAGDNYTDSVAGYRQHLDVMSMIDCMIAMEMANNVDGYRLSAGLYCNANDSHLKATIWDMNLGYGNADYYEGAATDVWAYDNNDMLLAEDDAYFVPFWWQRLLTDPAYRTQLGTRWKQCRAGTYSTAHVMATIDSLATVLNVKGAQQRNFDAWPRWGRYVWPVPYLAPDYDHEIAYLKDWCRRRLEFLDRHWLPLAPRGSGGDLSGDGIVDISDLNLLTSIILGHRQPEDAHDNPDLNGDGLVDVGDLNAIISAIIGR